MNTDFRVAVDFFTHHKARKLKKRLGSAAVLSLLQLWAYAAKLRTDGNLSGMTPEDIELAAEWEGEDGAFAAALEEIGFIDVQRPSDGRQTNADDRSTIFYGAEIRLHDWADHNQWAADYDDRRDKARFSRLATVNRKAFEKLKAQGVTAISKNDYDMLTKAQRPSDGRQTSANVAPTPSPAPSPALRNKKESYDSSPEQSSIAAGSAAENHLEAVVTLPLNTGEEHPVTQGELDQWKDLYPSVDVLQALRNMRGWLIGNAKRRKTKSGIGRFIQAWLAKEQDNPRASPATRIGTSRNGNAYNDGRERDYGQSDFGALGGNT